ncbi:MAG: AraC family transcriptional regulator [Butyrivibrio sp.]
MEKSIYYMENSIVCISVNELGLPLVSACDILTTSENFYHMDRTADFNVMIYVTDGTMYVTENGQDYEIAAGEILFLKSGFRHFGKYETLRGTRWFYAHFYMPETVLNCETALVLPKKIYAPAGSALEKKLYKMWDYFHSPDPAKIIRKNALFYEILIDIGSERQPESRNISDEICAFLDTQTDKDFSKELIGNSFFMSYSHLAAVFRKEKGISMGQYHNSARMNKACKLLRSTLMSVGEIAACLGFSDMLYFSKKFHAFSGVSPTEYRKQIQRRY